MDGRRQSRRALFPHEFFYQLLQDGELQKSLSNRPKDSWLYAATEKNLPIFVPGWEDSTLGNMYAGHCIAGDVKNVHTVRTGIEYMMAAGRLVHQDREEILRSDSFRSAAASRAIFRFAWCHAAPGSASGKKHAAVGLLLPDQRFDHELRLLFGRDSQRENHLGES